MSFELYARIAVNLVNCALVEDRRCVRSHDESRNNAIFGVLGFGEGWHNNHHAFPTSARHGLWWWQLDMSYIIIRVMALIGLARDVRTPSRDRIAAKRSA